MFVTQPKEPHYFALHGQNVAYTGPGDDATINRVAVTHRADYLALYPREHDYLALGDGSVSTLYYAERSVAEICRINPRMKVIVLLRDPVDRAYSSFLYMRARGFEPYGDFLEAVADETKRAAEGWHHLWHYTAMSRYADSLGVLIETLGEDQIGVWFYDDLTSDYVGTVRRMLRFLELPPVPGEATGIPRVNVSGTPRVRSAQRLISWATKNERIRATVKRRTSFLWREHVRRSLLNPSSPAQTQRAQLQPMFADDLARLRQLLPEHRLPTWLAGEPGGS